MVKKPQSIEGKNPIFLTLSHPDWFLPYIYILCVLIFLFFICIDEYQFEKLYLYSCLPIFGKPKYICMPICLKDGIPVYLYIYVAKVRVRAF